MNAWNPKNENERGIIKNRKRKSQIVDCSSVRIGNKTPMDIDGMMELNDEAMVFMEYKYRNAQLANGQRIAYERMIDAIQKSGKECVLFLCEHCVDNPEEDIDAATTIVRSYYYHGEWKNDGKGTLKARMDSFVNYIFHEYSAD